MSATRHYMPPPCVAAVLLAAQLFASAAQAAFVWGVNGHPLVSYPGVSIAEQLDALRDLGLTSYRVDVPGSEKTEALRELVYEGRARGITILPVVTPDFDLDKETPAALEKKAYDLAFALVSAFKGDIHVWELGNELENYAVLKRCEARNDGTPRVCLLGDASGKSADDYANGRWSKASAVLKGLTEGARAADPSVKRAIGTAGWGHIGAFERMKADGISWDISIWHMYGEDPEWAFKKLAQYGHPIWVTEFNNPYGSQRGKELQGKGIIKTMTRLRELQTPYNVQAAHIYELMDEPYWGKDNYEAFMGLVEMKEDGKGGWMIGETKPAYATVKEYIERIGARPPHEIALRQRCVMQPAAATEALTARAKITYAYCLVLGREPDGGGLDAWSTRLESDLSIEPILISMLQSYEFSKLYDVPKLSKREYVSLMYRLLIDADPPTPVLKQAAADLEAGKPATGLLEALVGSKEFHARHSALFAKTVAAAEAPAASELSSAKPEVRRNCDMGTLRRPLEFERGQAIYSYCLVLGRWPDGFGLYSWVEEMRNGMPLERFLLGLLQSDEFANKYAVSKLSNANFVTLLYRLLLGRDPDGAGLNSYVSQLATGAMSRSKLYEAILYSDEFRSKQEALYTARKPERPRAELEKINQ